jgi:hypothetical protein
LGEENFTIQEIIVLAGDEEAQRRHERQQEQMPRAMAAATDMDDQFQSLQLRLNAVEQAIAQNHEAVMGEVSSFRNFSGQRFNAITKSVSRIARQAPHQQWEFMNRQQQNRLQAQATIVQDRQGRMAAAGVGGATEQEQQQDGEAQAPTGNRRNSKETRGPLNRGCVLNRVHNLHELWQEWEWGINGSKPAKLWLPHERGGKQASTFCRRKYFWDEVIRHCNHGYDYRAAIDRIYTVYGRTSISSILKRMSQDKGKNPGLKL